MLSSSCKQTLIFFENTVAGVSHATFGVATSLMYSSKFKQLFFNCYLEYIHCLSNFNTPPPHSFLILSLWVTSNSRWWCLLWKQPLAELYVARLLRPISFVLVDKTINDFNLHNYDCLISLDHRYNTYSYKLALIPLVEKGGTWELWVISYDTTCWEYVEKRVW